MDACKTRLNQMRLSSRIQFQILSKLVRLKKQLQNIKQTPDPVIYLTVDNLKELFNRSKKRMEYHFLELEKLGLIVYVPLKPGGPNAKVSRYAIRVSEKVDRMIHKEFSLQRKIRSKQEEYNQEQEDFRY